MAYEVNTGNTLHESADDLRNEAETCEHPDTVVTQPCSPDVRQGNIYFVRAGEAIKIGFSTNSKSRIGALQTSNAEQLQLLGTIRGTRQDEHDLHQKFCHLHLRGEWFRDEDELTDFIADRQPEPRRPPASPATSKAVAKLQAKRRLYEIGTSIWNRYTNLMEQIRNYEHAPQGSRQLLADLIAKSVADIKHLAPVHAEH